MLYIQQLILSAFPAFLLCSATKVLPGAQHTAAQSEALLQIHNGILRARSYSHARNAPIPRKWDESSIPVSGASSESPLAAIKRELLGTRQASCDPGYALCDGKSLYSQPEKARRETVLTVGGSLPNMLP